MGWENIVKIKKPSPYSPRTVTVGEEPTEKDFKEIGIPEPFFDNLEESFLNDILELLPDLKMDTIEKIEVSYDKILTLDFLRYEKIPSEKKKEYLTDIKNKIVNEIFYIIIKPTLKGRQSVLPPYPKTPLKILQDRPNIDYEKYGAEGMLSDRFVDQAEELVTDIATTISRILAPYVKETTKKPTPSKDDDDTPRQEQIVETPASSVNITGVVYNTLLTGIDNLPGFRDIIGLDSDGKPNITSRVVKIFETHINNLYKNVYIHNASKFNDKIYAKVDKFFEQLQELDNSDKDNPYRKPIDALEGMSMLRIIMRIWFTAYRLTNVRNLNTGLNKPVRQRVKREYKPEGLKMWIGDKEFELTPQNAQSLQEEYKKVGTYSFRDPKAGEKTAKRKQELAEKQNQLKETLSKIEEIDKLLQDTDERKNEDGLLDLANLIDSGEVEVSVGGKSIKDSELVSSQKLRADRKELLRQHKELEATIRVKPSIEDTELIEATMAIVDPSYARSGKTITREGAQQTQSMRRRAELGAYDTPPSDDKRSKEEWEKEFQEAEAEMYGGGKYPKGGKVGKALDLLMVELGVASNTIIKEDNSKILQELNKKDKRLVKTLLQLAHPTEYFNEDALKLGELITVLKSLGIVNDNKTLKKKVLKYEDENLKVVKRAVRLRREYEKLYKSIREVIYPKSGEKNER
tara:strand:+ start:573 stop:2636 length:2064 start_codon:yes stop_codon:yes gene_type:complete